MRKMAPKKCIDFELSEDLKRTLSRQGVTSHRPYTNGGTGLIYLGFVQEIPVVIKTLRKDRKIVARNHILNEGKVLEILNKREIGAHLRYYDDSCVIMDYLQGIGIFEYLQTNSSEKSIQMFRELFNQFYVIDQERLDKKEGSRPDKHVILAEKANLIDFEKTVSSVDPRNLSGFLGAMYSKRFMDALNLAGIHLTSIYNMKKLVKEYLQKRSEKAYHSLVDVVLAGS
jgi:predicted Ser/Thr protein kinase